ncbi:TetR/AcrR family transcriptional regulator [Clostridioides mangenotii]|uniref:TetR/AcrR family transcriptional regulator n=1 Tax=Metaclostridioides mangenotii TaxID=1540 RepID=UPI002149C4BD|nr:TetR/AcrR family transcriptional regulator [Clostridioides mangenotii]MCR1955640.1 TetR/AcrR family transcriptional regulator [Clostridioides mangenotii]
MAGVKGNRRILYTKKVINESLLDLLQSKEIHQVTVTDICKRADINRGTFYSHYKDAFDLLQTMEDDLFNQIIEYIKDIPIENYKDILLLKVLKLIESNKDLCKILFCKQKDSRILNRILYVARKTDIERIFKSSGDFNNIYLDYSIKYAVGGTFAIIQSWLEGDLTESPEEIVEIINSIHQFTQKYFY